MTTKLHGHIVRANVQATVVIDTALSAVTYGGVWAQEYDARFADLAATT